MCYNANMSTDFNPKAVRAAFFRYAEERSRVLYSVEFIKDNDYMGWMGARKAVWSPRRDTAVGKAFWAGFEGKKNQQQFRFGSKDEAIYEAGKAYFESLGVQRCNGMRQIMVEEKTYRYVISARFIVIWAPNGDKTTFNKEDCGPKGRRNYYNKALGNPTVIGPNIIAYLIKHGKPPESFPGFCEYHNKFIKDAATTSDPFDAEIHGQHTEMLACPQCVHERAMDI